MTQVFTTGSGRSVIAGAELGHGGEGTILEVRGDPGRCIKVYNGRPPEATLSKLSAMVAHPPLDPTLGNHRHHSIAWPEQIRQVAHAAILNTLRAHDQKPRSVARPPRARGPNSMRP